MEGLWDNDIAHKELADARALYARAARKEDKRAARAARKEKGRVRCAAWEAAELDAAQAQHNARSRPGPA
jgi:hypothetical protein